ncbi:MAG: hypothetical protein ABI570_06845 [Ilumatobacteraceae bacterium]
MTIRKFAEWGQIISRPQAIETCDSDEQIGQTVARHMLEQTEIPHIHATGGSLARSLGDAHELSDTEVRELNVDLIHIDYRTSNGQGQSIAANSVLLRHRLWNGQIVAATNSGFLGTWEIATRAHPNDGRFDVVEIDESMTIRDRLITRRRLDHAKPLSHPSITGYQSDSKEWTFHHPIRLYVDQNFVAKVTFVRAKTFPDAIRMVI